MKSTDQAATCHARSTAVIVRFLLIAAATALLSAPVSVAAELPRARTEGDVLILETDHLSYQIGTDGANRALIDRRTGKNHLDPKRPSRFISVRRQGGWVGATAVELVGPYVNVSFGDPDISAKVKVRVLPQYLTLEIAAVNDPETVEVQLVRLPLTINDRVSHALASARDDEFAVAVVPANIETDTQSPYKGPTLLTGRAERVVRLVGAKVAVVGCPTEKLLDVIEQVELDTALPYPTLGGAWARTSPELMKSYLFVDLSEQTADAMIDYALAGGFGYIVVYNGIWNRGHGSYPVNTTYFPSGETGLKAVSDKIHAAGLKFGMHLMELVIDKTDPLVSPKPADGFMMFPQNRRTLAADIPADATFIPTATSPKGLLSPYDKSRFHGRDLRIGDEIVFYGGLQTTEPYGFTHCARGARGTVAAAHTAGADIDNFAEFINYYLPDVTTPLYDRIAAAVAEALDKYEFDYIYPDGHAENISRWAGPAYWHVSNLAISKLFHYTKREVMFSHPSISSYSWHIFSRGNTVDFVYRGVIEHFDHATLAGAMGCQTELQPFEFGWFGYMPHGRTHPATKPREMEYAWSKALAWGAAVSLETAKANLDANGRTKDIFALIKNWEELKLSGYFPQRIREQMQTPGLEFALQPRGDTDWNVLPVKYTPDHYVADLDDPQAAWQVDNPHAAQPLRVSIEAWPQLADHGHPTNVVLLDHGPLSIQTEGAGPNGWARQADGFTFGIDLSDTTTPKGDKSFHVTAANQGTKEKGWGCAELILDGTRDIRRHRALGAWVQGDNSGALLHFIVESGRWTVRDFYVKLDFAGWRYIKMPDSARGEVYTFAYPYSNFIPNRGIDFRRIDRMYVFITNLPPGKAVDVRFGRVEALRETHLPVRNPALTVNGSTITFPVEISPEGYLEFQASGTARVFNAKGFTTAEVEPGGQVPMLKPGANEIRFQCERADGAGQTVAVTFHTRGAPLR